MTPFFQKTSASLRHCVSARDFLFFVVCAIAGIFLAGCGKPPPPSNEVRVLTDTTFDAAIKKGIVLVDFWGAWCVPCVEQRAITAEIAAEVGTPQGGGVMVASLDLGFEEAREKVKHLNIEYVPTLIIFKNGHPFKTFEGLTPKAALLGALNEAKEAK